MFPYPKNVLPHHSAQTRKPLVEVTHCRICHSLDIAVWRDEYITDGVRRVPRQKIPALMMEVAFNGRVLPNAGIMGNSLPVSIDV
jgi:hypothetical protein